MQWEYLIKQGHLNESALDELGEDEWELITVLGYSFTHGGNWIFKRPLEDDDTEDE